jgi:hypothetical protein
MSQAVRVVVQSTTCRSPSVVLRVDEIPSIVLGIDTVFNPSGGFGACKGVAAAGRGVQSWKWIGRDNLMNWRTMSSNVARAGGECQTSLADCVHGPVALAGHRVMRCLTGH